MLKAIDRKRAVLAAIERKDRALLERTYNALRPRCATSEGWGAHARQRVAAMTSQDAMIALLALESEGVLRYPAKQGS